MEKTPLICRRFLENSHGGDTLRCSDLHTKYSFLWQVKMEDKWNDFKETSCLELESKYREPQIDGIHVNFPSCVVSGVPSVPDSKSYIDFDGMTLSVGNDLIKIRRLSTSSTAVESGPYCTTYNWYFEAWDDVWVRYGELLEPSDGESGETATTSSDDIERQYSVDKKRSISTQCSGNKYDLDLVEMTQTNTQTNVVRRIRRRAQAGPLVPGLSATSCPLPTEPKHTDKVDNSVASRTSDPNIESLVSALTSDEVMKKLAATLHAMQSNDNQHNKQQQGTASLLETPAAIGKLAGGTNSSFTVMTNNSSSSNNSVSKCSHEWYFEDDDGSWKKYGEKTATGHLYASDDVENQFKKNPAGYLQFYMDGSSYVINFSNMTQTNTSTGRVRKVRRVTAGVTPQPDAKQISKHSYEWYFQDDDWTWVKFGSKKIDGQAITTGDVEDHYLKNPATPLNFKLKTCAYELDFKQMIQTNKSTGRTRSVRRVAAGSPPPSTGVPQPLSGTNSIISQPGVRARRVPIVPMSQGSRKLGLVNANQAKQNHVLTPSSMVMRSKCNSPLGQITASSCEHYSSVPLDASHNKVYSTVLLQASNIEYQNCVSILGSCHRQTPSQVFKINNPYMRTAFENRKAYLQKQNPGVTYREELLFHGTKQNNIQSILEENIDWRLHGTNVGQNFGRGAYFSNSAQISIGYGQVIFICKVLVGLTAVGSAGTVRPPKDRNNRAVDTTVNNVAKPTIFVKYSSEEYYPEYYVLF